MGASGIKWIGVILACIGGLAGFAAYFLSGPTAATAAVTALLSLALLFGLIVWFPNAFVLTRMRNWNGPTANFLFAMPIAFLFGFGFNDHFVRLEGLALAAAAMAALAVVGMIWAPRPEPVQTPRSHILLAILFGASLGWSGVGLINCKFDTAPGQTYQVTVQKKYTTYGKGTHYHLTLAPFGPVANPGTVDVGYTAWNGVSEGGSVCAQVRPGALGFAWWKVGC